MGCLKWLGWIAREIMNDRPLRITIIEDVAMDARQRLRQCNPALAE
jgi:hypothetical protein